MKKKKGGPPKNYEKYFGYVFFHFLIGPLFRAIRTLFWLIKLGFQKPGMGFQKRGDGSQMCGIIFQKGGKGSQKHGMQPFWDLPHF